MAKPLAVELCITLVFLCVASIVTSIWCVFRFHEYTKRIKEMQMVCQLLGWWLFTLCLSFGCWGVRMAWTGSAGFTVREMIWYVPMKLALMVLPLIAITYWMALVYRSEKMKSHQGDGSGNEYSWVLTWLDPKKCILLLAISYVPWLIASGTASAVISTYKLDRELTASYPQELKEIVFSVYAYVTALCGPVLYLLAKVSFDDVYGIRKILIIAMFDAGFWTQFLFWMGIFQSETNEKVDVGTLLIACFFTSQTIWVYLLTWKARSAYQSSFGGDEFHALITVRPQTELKQQQQQQQQLQQSTDTGLTRINMDHLALSLLSTSVEPVNGICPPMETHPLWKLLVKPDNQDFHEFSSLCEKSFCSENLVVWKKLYELFVAWKTKQEKISRYKAELVTKFLGPSAFWPLNLTSDLLEHVSLWVNEPDLTDLDFQYPEGMIARIIAEVFSNLQQDMWVRFLKTKK